MFTKKSKEKKKVCSQKQKHERKQNKNELCANESVLPTLSGVTSKYVNTVIYFMDVIVKHLYFAMLQTIPLNR